MSYFRSYFEKNNTIIKDSQTNTAFNPTTEVFYGSGFSKFIFRVDFTDLKNKIINNELVVTTGTTHTLHLTNTIFGDNNLLGLNRNTGRDRATSFDLILFEIPSNQYWDEGIGYDYQDNSYDFVSGNRTYDERPSNWFYRTTMNTWGIKGIFDDTPNVVKTIHFDHGNEDINVDITDYVNRSILPSGYTVGNTTYTGYTTQGLGICFAVVYSYLNPDVDQSVAFFTKYTQTFFEPYVESHFDNQIDDNRDNFLENINQNLYLYVNKNNNPINLDSNPMVDILDTNGDTINGLQDLQTELVRKGVYKVTFSLNIVGGCNTKKFYYDNWKNIMLDGSNISDVKQKFIPQPLTSGVSIGKNPTDSQKYAIQYHGIKLNEKIKSGDIRKIVLTFRSIDNPKSVVLDEVYYNIYIMEGHTKVIVHDWTLLDKTNENSFLLDTSYLIPREYTMEFKTIVNSEELQYKEPIRFEIVSVK